MWKNHLEWSWMWKNPISKPGSKHKKELQNQGKYSKN